MHIQIIISIHLYHAQYLYGMRYPYLLLLLKFVLLSLMSGCIFKLAQLLLFYVPLRILLHEPFIEKKKKKKAVICFKPGYILQEGLTSPLELVSVL